MKLSSPLVLTFLLNAVWQVALIAGLAALGSWLLRNSVARYRHWLWSSALCLAFFVPAFTASQTLLDSIYQSNAPLITNEAIPPLVASTEPFTSTTTLPLPVTVGLFHPAIILPEPLLREGNLELLTSAIGHEFIHVARQDYLLNFIYELLFVPISFHPAAALLRRRVKQTRELCCDELVAERILNAEVYARSLVRLASSAPPLRRLSVTTTVGIADADILEARIMSLLRKPELNTRWKRLLLIVVSLLLLVPCAAAATYAMRFDVEPRAQDPAPQEKERTENEKREMKARVEREGFKWKVADPKMREEMVRKEQMEMEMREVRQAALVRLAKINMDQAIQIATSQSPGKVIECNLEAFFWKEPGKLADDGVVFYHVMIANENAEGATHIWVNAVDGSIIKTEKEQIGRGSWRE